MLLHAFILMFIFTFQHLLWASRLHGNVESVAILSFGPDNRSKERDSIILAFQDAKISVVEYNDSIHGLCTRYAHLWHNILFFLFFQLRFRLLFEYKHL